MAVHASGAGTDLNEFDLVVGEDYLGRPWSWTPTGGLVDLAPLLGLPRARPTTVNDSGHIGGTATDAAGPSTILFLHDGSTLHEITLGLPSTGAPRFAGRMNEVGQFVGGIESGTSRHAFLYDVSTGTAIDIHPASGPLAGFETSHGHDVNDAGQIVGTAFPTRFSWPRAMLIEDGETTDLQEFMPSDVFQSEAIAINNAGVIVGAAWNVDPITPEGYRLTPTDLDASIRVAPRTLNVGILLGSLTARIAVAPELRDEVDLASIELRSLGGRRIPGGLRPASINLPGRGLIHARFDRRDLQPAIDAVRPDIGADLALTLAGRLDDGSVFVLQDAVAVVGLETRGTGRVRRPLP